MSTEPGPILLERHGAVAKITLSRPDAANALDLPLTRALLDAAIAVDADASVRAVVLTGSGRMFCAGGDIGVMAASGDNVGAVVGELASTLHLAMSRLARMNKPLVNLVNGPAAGAGYGLAISGDVVLAARSAMFHSAYAALGVSPDGGLSWLLPRLVGLRRAQEIIISNRKVTAAEAEAMGIVSRAVDDEALQDEGMALAVTLAAGPVGAIGRMRGLLLATYEHGLETHLELEARGIAAAAAGPEGREGVAAFLGRREPDFTGETR